MDCLPASAAAKTDNIHPINKIYHRKPQPSIEMIDHDGLKELDTDFAGYLLKHEKDYLFKKAFTVTGLTGGRAIDGCISERGLPVSSDIMRAISFEHV